MTPDEKLSQIIKAADYVVAIAKQERYKNIRLDSMKKALDNWDQVRENYAGKLCITEGKQNMADDIVVRLQKNIDRCDDEICGYCPVDKDAIDEIVWLRTALQLAVGQLSTYNNYRFITPTQIYNQFLKEAKNV